MLCILFVSFLFSCFPCFSSFLLSIICASRCICHLGGPLFSEISPPDCTPKDLLCFITLFMNLSCFYLSEYPNPRHLYPSTSSSLSPFLSISVSFIFFLYHHYSFSLSFDFFYLFFCRSSLCCLHPFISGLVALMSVAMARSIQDGVFVLCTERKINVAAVRHSLPCV